jgi:hypothetical protein
VWVFSGFEVEHAVHRHTRRPAKMPLLDPEKMNRGSVADLVVVPAGRGPLAAGRELPGDHPLQLSAGGRAAGAFRGEYSPDPDADAAAGDPMEVTRAHVEAFPAWMIETRSASTALNKHKGLQQFFKWLMPDEGEIDRSPMERVRQPKSPQKLVPVTRTVLQHGGASFRGRQSDGR